MHWLYRGDWDNSNILIGLKIGPLLREIQTKENCFTLDTLDTNSIDSYVKFLPYSRHYQHVTKINALAV